MVRKNSRRSFSLLYFLELVLTHLTQKTSYIGRLQWTIYFVFFPTPHLARISHQHSCRAGQPVLPDVEEASEGKVHEPCRG